MKEIVIVREGLMKSLIADTYTFVVLLGVLGVNHYLLNDSIFGAWVLTFMLFLLIFSKTNSSIIRLKGVKQLKEYLEKIKDDI